MILIDSNYLELKMHSQVNIRKMNYTKIVFFAFLTDSQKFKDDKMNSHVNLHYMLKHQFPLSLRKCYGNEKLC